MAVDNFYRLIVRGPRHAVSAFRRGVVQIVDRPAIGKIEGWREFVPLSLEAIRRRYENVWCATSESLDPYEISVWPTRRVGKSRSEIRYQFQTRNCEFMDFLKPLSRRFPALTFVLVTLWLDLTQIASFQVRRGVVRGWKFPLRRRQWHWDRARQRFGIDGDAVYEDDDAEFFAEEGMLYEAQAHWTHGNGPSPRGAIVPPRRKPSWWNRPKVRDLDFERQLTLMAVNEESRNNKKKRKGSQPRLVRRGPGLLLVGDEDTADEILLYPSRKQIPNVNEFLKGCLERLTTRLWTTCYWPNKLTTRRTVPGHRFLVLSTDPDEKTGLYVQFWSEPGALVLMEVCSGEWNPSARKYIGATQRTMIMERGFRVGGKAKNFRKHLKILGPAAAQSAAREALEILFDVFCYRGRSSLELRYESDRESLEEHS